MAIWRENQIIARKPFYYSKKKGLLSSALFCNSNLFPVSLLVGDWNALGSLGTSFPSCFIWATPLSLHLEANLQIFLIKKKNAGCRAGLYQLQEGVLQLRSLYILSKCWFVSFMQIYFSDGLGSMISRPDIPSEMSRKIHGLVIIVRSGGIHLGFGWSPLTRSYFPHFSCHSKRAMGECKANATLKSLPQTSALCSGWLHYSTWR